MSNKETGGPAFQNQHEHEVSKNVLDAYCSAWKKSFESKNPYHTLSMDEEDREHINAGLSAALKVAMLEARKS